MANNVYTGNAIAKAQSQYYTFGGTWVVGETVTVTINSKTWVYTLVTGDTVIATLVANLVLGFNALDTSYYPEFYGEITSSQASTTTRWVFTSNLAGRPFTVALSTNSALGTISSATVTQASVGPNHWDDPLNWSAGTIPAATEDVYIEKSSYDILYGLDQSALSALTSLNISKTYTGRIGLPNVAAGGYQEYRQKYLVFKATTVNVGYGDSGTGSPRIKWNGSSTQTTVNVLSTGQSEIEGEAALQILGTHASNALNITKGSVSVATWAGETSTLATVRLGYTESQASDANLELGTGVTLSSATITMAGGRLVSNSAISALTINGGTATIMAGTVGTLTLDAGNVYYQSTGTITTLAVGSNGDIDFSRDLRARAITNTVSLYERAGFYDPQGTISGTPVFTMVRGAFSDLTRFDLGVNKTITRS